MQKKYGEETYELWGQGMSQYIPWHKQEVVYNYVIKGLRPENFLYSIITNNLIGAVNNADEISIKRIPDFVRFFYNYAPAICWGDEKSVEEWIEKGGWNGIQN